MSTYFLIAIFSAICSLILKKKNAEISLVLGIAGVAFIFLSAISLVTEVVENVQSLGFISADVLVIPIKLLGLSILTKITVSVCEDAGEKALAVTTNIVSRFAAVGIAFPLFERLLELIRIALQI